MESVVRDLGMRRMLPGKKYGAASRKLVQGSRAWSVASGGQLRGEGSAALSGVGVAGRSAL